jgi:hypothetical protein
MGRCLNVCAGAYNDKCGAERNQSILSMLSYSSLSISLAESAKTLAGDTLSLLDDEESVNATVDVLSTNFTSLKELFRTYATGTKGKVRVKNTNNNDFFKADISKMFFSRCMFFSPFDLKMNFINASPIDVEKVTVMTSGDFSKFALDCKALQPEKTWKLGDLYNDSCVKEEGLKNRSGKSKSSTDKLMVCYVCIYQNHVCVYART